MLKLISTKEQLEKGLVIMITSRYRTKEEQIQYFKYLAYKYDKLAAQLEKKTTKNALSSDYMRGKAEAYELAAFELKHNMR